MLRLLQCLPREKPSREVGTEPKPHPGKDGDGWDLPGTMYREDEAPPPWDPPVMGFPQCFGFFPLFSKIKPRFQRCQVSLFAQTLAKRKIKGRSPQTPVFQKQEVQLSPRKLPGS